MIEPDADVSDDEDGQTCALVLYVVGATPASARAVANCARICREYLNDQVELDVVDLYEHPERAAEDDVVVAPTLLRTLPPPVRAIVGDLSDERKVLIALGRALPDDDDLPAR